MTKKMTNHKKELFSLNIYLNNLFVPPYTSSQDTIWSPLLSKEAIVVVAPKPDAKVNACFPLSNAAKHSSSVFLVGFPDLPYSKP